MTERKRTNETTEDALRDRWETVVRRSAAATVRRAERQAAVERFCGVANRCALAVGLLLVVEFPFVCAALETTRASTAAYCEMLAAAEVDAEPSNAFATNVETAL
ncbi:MAG: hypothetical protein IJN32_06730 [Thermoguttaceae bacterium]|nr:hypothetical protein [Thermoguttaceae bacterium]